MRESLWGRYVQLSCYVLSFSRDGAPWGYRSVQPTRQAGQRDAHCHDQRAEIGGSGKSYVLEDQPADPCAKGDAEVEGADVQARGHIDCFRGHLTGDLHHVGLQRRHIGEGEAAPARDHRHRGHRRSQHQTEAQ